MRTLVRSALLVLSLSFLIPQSAVALERPACGAHPGACFFNLVDIGVVGFFVNDNDGDLLIAQIPTSADDFLKIQPDGRVFAHIQDIQSQVFVCPVTALPGCLDDSLGNPGLLAGSGRFLIDATLTSQFEPSCPAVGTAAGTVMSETGAAFSMTFIFAEHPDGKGGCKVVFDDIKLTTKATRLQQPGGGLK